MPVGNLPWDSIQLPPDLTDDVARFLTRANCLAGIQQLTGDLHGAEPHESIARDAMQAVKPKQGAAIDPKSAQILRVAWQTEVAACMGSAFDDPMLKRVGMMTQPVNAYYALFNAQRCLSRVKGSPTDTHSAMHRTFATQIVGGLPMPWCATMSGDAHGAATACIVTPGFIQQPYGFNLLERGHAPANYLWATLRTVRRWKLEIAREEWLKKNRKKDGTPYKSLPAGKPAEIATTMRPTTLVDFMYEMRRHSSYVGGDEYGTDVLDADVARFVDGLESLLDTGMLLTEAQLARLVGVNTLRDQANAWAGSTKRLGEWATFRLRRRLDAIAAVA